MTYLHCQMEKDNLVFYIIITAPGIIITALCKLDSYN